MFMTTSLTAKIVVLLVPLSILLHVGQTAAQLGPVPLPSPQLPSGKPENNEFQESIDEVRSPFKVELINKQLSEGKNVLRIQVPSDHEIINCMINYTTHSTNKITYCVKESNSSYKGLVDAEYPNQTIEVMVSDISNNTVTLLDNLSVQKGFSFRDIPQAINDWICNTIKKC
jgi:hypothetical protein